MLNDYSLALKVEDFDAAGSGSTQPISVWGENKGIDNIAGLQGIEVLALVQIPEHGDTVLATRCGKRTIGGNRNGVDVTGVAVVVGLQLELREFPDLIKCISDCWQKLNSTEKKRQRSWWKM